MRLTITLLALAACATAPDEGFVPIASDFDDFRAWDRTPVTDDGDDVPEAVYANDLALGGAPYPIGAIFVKADEIGDPTAWRLHAMVKRGDGSEAPMRGWEVFELFVDVEDRTRVVWRGWAPPAGIAGYGDDNDPRPCVDCHDDAERDFVLSR